MKSARDTLRPYLYGAQCLDLFAGQGRFGHAALVEGATQVVFVEKDAKIAAALKRDLAKFPAARIESADALAYLERLAAGDTRYDIVFADPPFSLWSPDFEKKLFTAVLPVLVKKAIFLVKHPARVIPSDSVSGLTLWKTTPFGESKLFYWKYG